MTFTVMDCEQRSEAWFAARAGRLTGSVAGNMLATLRSGQEAAARRDLRTQLVCERLTGAIAEPGFINADMQRGIDLEPEAMAEFEAHTGLVVMPSGFIRHDEHMAGCSLDGHIGNFEAIVEVKCPRPANHLECLRGGSVPARVVPQLANNCWVTGAERAYFVSYCETFPASLRLFVAEVEARNLGIPEYERRALEFLKEVDADLAEVEALMQQREAA